MTERVTHLAAGRDRFVGRTRELDQLQRNLADHRLVTILGEGGSGKTRLARHFGAQTEALAEFWICDLVHARDRDDLVGSVAETLGIEIAKSASVTEIGEAMSERGPMLLILDNLEQMAEAAAFAVDTWLEVSPNVTFLATSREPLRIRGEIRVQLEPLASEAAVDLFVSRARELRPDFELDDERRAVVERIVDRLDGLPLAIELAASRTNLYSVSQLADRLESSIEVLRSDSRSVEQRHRTMRDAIAWSWELLDETERALLAEASIFIGGFSLESAREVLVAEHDGPVAPIIESLVDKSLMRRVAADDLTRFDLLEPVREFAAEKLADDRRRAVERRHARHFADMILETRVPRIGRDVDNVVAAFWNVVDHDAELAAEAALASYMLLRNRGAYPKIREIVERARVREIDADMIAAKLHGVRARCMLHDGEYREAFAAIDGGLERAEAADDARSLVFMNSLKSRLFNAIGQPKRAGEHLERALDYTEEVDDPWLESTVRGRLAAVAFDRGQFDEAERKLAETTMFCRTHDLEDMLAHALATAACHVMAFGELERAESLLDRAADVHPGGEEWFGLEHQTERGFLEAARGDEEAARTHFEEALESGEIIGNRRRRIPTLYGLSSLVDGDEEPSALLAILEIVEGTDDTLNQVQARTRLGVTRLRQGRYAVAEPLFEEALEGADEFELPRVQPHVACWLAVASAGLGESERADSLLDRASERFAACEDGETLADEVDTLFRPVADICGADDMPDRSAVGDLERLLRDTAERRSDDPRANIWLWRGWDHRAQLSAVLEGTVAELERAHPDALLRVARDGSRFAPPGEDAVDLRSREVLSRILRRLAELRAEAPEAGLEVDEVVDIGWPDEVLTESAGKGRVYTAVRNLRSMGLDGVLETGPQGYHLDPETPFAWMEK